MADIKWIKICTDIFDDEKILLIESLPEADSIVVIWFKLLCFAGKQSNGGVFILNEKIAYTDEMFATIFRRSVETIRLAFDTFESFGMIKRVEGVVTIPNWEKYQSLDALEKKKEYNRKYMEAKRAKEKLLVAKSGTTSNTTVVSLDKDIEEEKEKDKDIEKDNLLLNSPQKDDDEDDDLPFYPDDENKNTDFKLQSYAIFETWNSCESTIKHKELNEFRIKAIKKVLKTYKCEEVVEAIKHYDTVVRSRFYFNYRWSLEDFLNRKNGISTFTSEGSNWNSYLEALKKDCTLNPNYTKPVIDETKKEVPNPLKDFLNKL